MPPKPPKSTPPAEAKSKELVKVGPRHITAKYAGKRTESGEKPTTARALVLRNGKYGSQGTGEMVLANKISGREKLDLLGEDLLRQRVEMAKKSLGTPFSMEKSIRIAHSQFDSHMEDITSLQDPDFFAEKIKREVQERTRPEPGKKRQDPLLNASKVASIVATRVHNSYMLASAWKIVRDTLHELDDEGLRQDRVRVDVRRNERLRSLYLVMYDMVNIIVETYHANFRVLVTTTDHYARYFKTVATGDPDDAEIAFDWMELRAAYRSFLDSIIIELARPQSEFPRHILYSILRDAVDESPREAKRFPQLLWDAVGDLSFAVELAEMIESPLFGADYEQLKKLPRSMPEEYEQWVDAQLYSLNAVQESSAIASLVVPLDRTKSRMTLEAIWKTINTNYKAASGKDIDHLWQLEDEKKRTPQWHSFRGPEDELYGKKKARGTGKARLAITNGNANDSDASSMPDLQSVSDSSQDAESEESSDEEEEEESDDEYDSNDSDDENGYDSDDEVMLREYREAMEVAFTSSDFVDPNIKSEDLKFEDEASENRFLKLMTKFRGYWCSTNATLKATSRDAPRSGFTAVKPKPTTKPVPGKPTPVKPATTAADSDSEMPGLEPIPLTSKKPQPPKGRGVTMEEVEDEETIEREAKKKKKKKPKKKKKAPSSSEQREDMGSPEPPEVVRPSTPVAPTTPATGTSPLAASPSKKKKKSNTGPSSPTPSPAKPSSATTSQAYLPQMSTQSLPILPEETAQSTHSYLQAQKLAEKTKIKSRPDHASLFSIPEKKKGIFSRFGRDKNKVPEDPPKKGSKNSWFSKLGRKTSSWMHQLLGTGEDERQGKAGLKWDRFVQLMKEMGFTYVPSTAGSSVRFDPPNPKDRSVTFHKPHPDSTIHPIMLKEFGKKLKDAYGWDEADFVS
ncbi:hypothetical protein JAAARDRAFT_35330 [Jaapia argillacea MUCL 33604]|uniref:Type II toxin-antitoxin system HicA family toxin n=1 Tax=Jaapia argillacea MUCL 33604 TaxID=933084 RepID=A0A067PUU4_9AGAM|nr:hypothetical protein JAAARDRAFT_35330 [Jaapia argillacea MUCL 33604]